MRYESKAWLFTALPGPVETTAFKPHFESLYWEGTGDWTPLALYLVLTPKPALHLLPLPGSPPNPFSSMITLFSNSFPDSNP